MQNKNFLEKIIELKRLDLSLKAQVSGKFSNPVFKDSDTLRFRRVFIEKKDTISLIAEIKFASPTNPTLGSPKALLQQAKQYEQSGADAVSLITEKRFFKGSPSFVTKVKEAVTLPVLQKDFVIDSRQIYEAKEIGSDALLLITRLIDGETLKKFVNICLEEGIEPVVEINNEEDLQKAIETETKIIAVNARDLETFTIDISSACSLIKKIPDHFIKLGFSGIHSSREVQQYKKAGANGVLAGTSLMQTNDIDKLMNSLKI